MIKTLELNNDLAQRFGSKKKRVRFTKGVNVIVGANGSGKSTIISSIREIMFGDLSRIDSGCVRLEMYSPSQLISFDFEADNPRTMDRSLGPDSSAFQLASKFRSHGEVGKDLILSILSAPDGSEPVMILIDEPDQALDMPGALNLKASMKRSKASQVIISAHHPILVLSREFNVIELTKGYIRSTQAMVDAISSSSLN